MDLVERRAGLTRRHPWETARAEFFLDALQAHGAFSSRTRFLDVGSGDAWLAAQVHARGGDVTCLDPGYGDDDLEDLVRAHPGMSFVQNTPAGRFDWLLCLDVLEHVEDDLGLLAGLVGASLVPTGHAIISVPAWQGLFSRHDRMLHHHRRYSPQAACGLVQAAGLEIEVAGGLFHTLLLPRVAQLVVEKMRQPLSRDADGGATLGDWRAGSLVTRAIHHALRLEGRASMRLASRGIQVPGLSWFAVSHRVTATPWREQTHGAAT